MPLVSTASRNAYRSLPVDSTQHTYNRCALAEDTKRWEYRKKATIRHHALIDLNGKIVSQRRNQRKYRRLTDTGVVHQDVTRHQMPAGRLGLQIQRELSNGRRSGKSAPHAAKEELPRLWKQPAGQNNAVREAPKRRLQDVCLMKHHWGLFPHGQGSTQF